MIAAILSVVGALAVAVSGGVLIGLVIFWPWIRRQQQRSFEADVRRDLLNDTEWQRQWCPLCNVRSLTAERFCPHCEVKLIPVAELETFSRAEVDMAELAAISERYGRVTPRDRRRDETIMRDQVAGDRRAQLRRRMS